MVMRCFLVVGAFVIAVVGTFFALQAVGYSERQDSIALSRGISAEPDGGRTTAGTGISGIIEYTVRGPDGKIKEHDIIYNTVNDEGLNDTFNLITATGSGTYDGIAALSVTVAADDPSDGVLSTSIELLLDGDSVTGGDQNPADGTVTTDFGSETGNGTVAVTFTATGAADVLQIVLTRSIEDATGDGALAIADSDIFAYVESRTYR